MAILSVGPTSLYLSIAAALADAVASDTITLDGGYSSETVAISAKPSTGGPSKALRG
jgi:hypothetical protein